MAANALQGHYVDAAGIIEVREEISGFYRLHFGIETDADRVIVGNGSKELMFMIFSMVSGSVILPSPSWIGYAPQLRFLGKPYHILPTRLENGYKIDSGRSQEPAGEPCCQPAYPSPQQSPPPNRGGSTLTRSLWRSQRSAGRVKRWCWQMRSMPLPPMISRPSSPWEQSILKVPL